MSSSKNKQSINVTSAVTASETSSSNYVSLAISQFKTSLIYPAESLFYRASPMQRVAVLTIGLPVLATPALIAIVLAPFFVFAALVSYILLFGAQKTERDVKQAIQEDLGLDVKKGVGMVRKGAVSTYVSVYNAAVYVGMFALDYLIAVHSPVLLSL